MWVYSMKAPTTLLGCAIIILISILLPFFQRRLSDPSSNLNNYTRSGWRSKSGGGADAGAAVNAKRTRSQNEGLDYCGLAEIEAGDVRDGELILNHFFT